MDLTKFLSLLVEESLFFSRGDKLGDPFEGSFTKLNEFMRPIGLLHQSVPPERIQEMARNISKGLKHIPRNVVVNCWHENNYESEAMWKLYGRDAGISVKTTFKGLSDSLKCDRPVFIGRIQYVDYNTTIIAETNAFTSLLHKRKSFEHEREVRAMAFDTPPDESIYGRYLEVDIFSLIEEVIVAPYSKDWFLDLVKSVVGRYGLQAPVLRSDMDADPIW